MEYRRLGHSGLKVSPLCLGAMMFGSRRTVGVSFFGTLVVHRNHIGTMTA